MKKNKQKHVEKQATKPVTENRRQESKGTNDIRAERKYKDTVFRMLFKDKTRLLSLYNAVNGSHHENPEDLQIVTLENAIYMSVKNDLAFIVDLQLHLYEHQSTVNPNMPLRFLQYVAKEYEKLTIKESLYTGQLVEIPTPKFLVFYNGVDNQPERQVLRLSNAFLTKQDEPQLELQVEVLNINAGYNMQIKEQCKALEEYMQYVDCVRKEAENKELEDAVSSAVDKCIEQGILSDFLLANKAEVVSMSIFEYDEEKAKKAWIEIGEARGRELGTRQGIHVLIETCKELGQSKEETTERIMKKYKMTLSEAAEYVEKMWKNE